MLNEAINYDHYKDKLAPDTFEFIVNIDPTEDKKYAQWLLRTFLKKYISKIDYVIETFPEYNWQYPISMEMIKRVWDDEEIRQTNLYHFFYEVDVEDELKDALYDFHFLKIKNGFTDPNYKNIMNVPDFASLFKIISDHREILEKLQLETFDKSEVEKWYSDSRWVIVSPLTHKASCKYGANTKWCTASRDDPYHFNAHINEGPLIIIIDKQENEKYQLHMATNQWKNELDEELEDRSYFIGLLPELALKVLYYKTKNILFISKIGDFLRKLSSNKEAVKDIMGWIFGSDLAEAWEHETSNNPYDYPLTKELLLRAISEHYYEAGDFDDDSYNYGYTKPWEFIDETPANIHEAEPCSQCDGNKYILPHVLSDTTYDRIESGSNDFVNNKLTSQEQKYFLSLYKKIEINNQIKFELIRDDDVIRDKLEQPCTSCKGIGVGNMLDANLYSDEQREKAGDMSQNGNIESTVEEIARSFRSYSRANQDYGNDYIEEIMDQAIALTTEMPDKYATDFVLMTSAVAQSKDSKGFTNALNLYLEPFLNEVK